MLTYNEVVDLVEKVDPNKIEAKVNQIVTESQQETKEYVDEKVAGVKKYYLHRFNFRYSTYHYDIIINYIDTSSEMFTDGTLVNVTAELLQSIINKLLTVFPKFPNKTASDIPFTTSIYQQGQDYNKIEKVLAFDTYISLTTYAYTSSSSSIALGSTQITTNWAVAEQCIEL